MIENAAYLVRTISSPEALRLDSSSDGLVLYVGKAAPGVIESEPYWRIFKAIFTSEGDATLTWADGNGNADNVWDDRLTLSYS